MSLLLVLLMSACGASAATLRDSPTEAPRCPVSKKLVPSCGALLGITPPDPSLRSLQEVESTLGRRVDFVYRFHDVDDAFPDSTEKALVKRGTLLHIEIDSRNYASKDRSSVTWADVAAGRYDADLWRQARGVADLGVPIFLTFGHEPDQPRKRALGTPAEFRAAWQHVWALYRRAGARNAVWVWVVMGWQPAYERAAAMWPGSAYVDWISWEAYNHAGCQSGPIDSSQYSSFEAGVSGFSHWLSQHRTGVDQDLPIMISELGSVDYPGSTARAAQWYGDISAVLRRYPRVKAIGIWDHQGAQQGCDFRLAARPQSLAAVKKVAADTWLNTQRSTP